MHICDVMKEEILFVDCDMSLAELYPLLEELGVDGGVVISGSREIMGTVSKSDVVHTLLPANTANTSNGSWKHAYELMIPRIIHVDFSADVQLAAKVMAVNRVDRVVILENERIVGMASAAQVLPVMRNAAPVEPRLVMAKNPEDSSASLRRVARRYPLNIPVEFENGAFKSQGVVQNISVTGALVGKITDPPSPGSAICLRCAGVSPALLRQLAGRTVRNIDRGFALRFSYSDALQELALYTALPEWETLEAMFRECDARDLDLKGRKLDAELFESKGCTTATLKPLDA